MSNRPSNILPLDGIFLDLYGTITAGDRAAVHAACERIVADLSLPVSAERFAVQWGEKFFVCVDDSNHDRFRTLVQCECESLADTLADFGRQADPMPYVQMLDSYWRDPPVHADVLDAVARLPLPVCIVSNADSEPALAALARHGLRFAHVVTSEDARHYKPHAAIFQHALQRTGWRADRVLHVGDSLHSDIRGATQAGLHAAWICRDDRIHDIGTAEPHHTIRDLHGLVSLLHEWPT